MFEHPIFAGHPDRVAAWAWMLATAAWKDTRQDANGKTVTVKRGQLLTSYRQMSRATGVPIQPLRTLMDRLQGEDAINTDTSTGRLLVTICNYDKYQSVIKDSNTGGNTPATQDQHRTNTQNEQGNKYNNIPVGADKSADPVKVLFDSGIKLLTEAGKSEAQARSILGKWKSAHGTEAVITALGRAQREGAIEPVGYIERCFKFQAKKDRPEPGARRTHPVTGQAQYYINHAEGWMNEVC